MDTGKPSPRFFLPLCLHEFPQSRLGELKSLCNFSFLKQGFKIFISFIFFFMISYNTISSPYLDQLGQWFQEECNQTSPSFPSGFLLPWHQSLYNIRYARIIKVSDQLRLQIQLDKAKAFKKSKLRLPLRNSVKALASWPHALYPCLL